jgi:hypothetical protein
MGFSRDVSFFATSFPHFLITSTAMLRGLTVQAELHGGPCRWPSPSNFGGYLHESREAP